MTDLGKAWRRLRTEGTKDGEYVRLRVPSKPAHHLYVAKRAEDGLEAAVYELRVSSLPGDMRWPEGVGFDLERHKLGRKRSGQMRLVLRCAEPRFGEVFRVLAEDVIGHVAETPGEREGVVELVSQLHRWQAFLRQHGAHGLSEHAQTGLFGELWVLSRDLGQRVGHAAGVAAWQGPLRTAHDFQLSSCSIEVKTTAAVNPKFVKITNWRQLDGSTVPVLFLCVVEVSKAKAAQLSLPELVSEVRGAVSEPERSRFEELLRSAGYLDIHAQKYADVRYSVRRTRWFQVADGFPRVLQCDTHEGVSDLTYSIAIAACLPFERDVDHIDSTIIGKSSDDHS